MGTKERWKPIQGWSVYEVSNLGRVRSVDRTISMVCRGMVCEKFVTGRILKTRPVGAGYQYVNLSQDGDRGSFYVHRLVATAFIPNPRKLPCVLHDDDDPTNNQARNLAWGTNKDNSQDMVNKGRQSHHATIGSAHGMAKLVDRDIPKIRRMLRRGYGIPDIAKTFGVKSGTIKAIRDGVRWAHV